MNQAVILDLLEERRAVAEDRRRATDPGDVEYLDFELARLDRELDRARGQQRKMNAAAARGTRR